MRKIIALLILKVVMISGTWSPPYLESMHEKVNVTYEDRGSNFTTITISMDEEIPTPAAIARFTGYNINETSPLLGSFTFGTKSNLGITFDNQSSLWEMVLNVQQDYENPDMRFYTFDLGPIDGISSTVILFVRNIFDSPPRITQHDNPCVVEEYNPENFVSGCIFEVLDPDGMQNNIITFSVDDAHKDLFAFEEITSNKTTYTSNFTLIVKKELNFMQNVWYMFDVIVADVGNNTTPISVIVKVKNVPSRPPVWTMPFASARFPEKEHQQFQVQAIDGDREIDDDIFYRFEFHDGDYSSFISIDNTSGIIAVNAIDRDEMEQEVFSFIIIAYKSKNFTNFINSTAVLIVDDINDHDPVIYFDDNKKLIQLWESEFATLFTSSELSVNDIDLGVNAIYSVSLLNELYATAFNIIPTSGYQQQNFTISVANPDLLDYEDVAWGTQERIFNITIKAEETQSIENHNSTSEFQVKLLNWNDEIPEFEQTVYEFNVSEIIEQNQSIGFIKANDKDVNDSVIYFLTGIIAESLSLNSTTGELMTINDDVFDYERQTEVYFQAFANDTLQTPKNEPIHTIFTQIRINVIDENDTPPQLILPQGILKIKENDKNWTSAGSPIIATDLDTDPDLEFFILWDNSSVSGSNSDETNYRESLIIEIDSNVTQSKNQLTGILKVNPAFPYDIDYEKYHFMYIMIGVRDKNTVKGVDSAYAILTIEIEDENDNAPRFIGNTLNITRRVIEEADIGVFVGTIMAVDDDGPGNNEITYSIVSKNSSATPDNWLTIDSETGDITVNSKEISCDSPNIRDTLDYIVYLFDGVNTSEGDISINITDVNNKYPQFDFDLFNSTLEVFENETDLYLTTISAHDNDRDDPHNKLFFSIVRFPDFFTIDSESGELSLNISDGPQLDRDNGVTQHTITIRVNDNNGVGNFLQNETTVTIILNDCNDNAPEMPTLNNLIFSESLTEGYVIVNDFYAPDKDQGSNAEVDYEILSIEYVGDDAPSDFNDLFIISNTNDFRAQIKAGKNLRGYSGSWNVNILARDRGASSDAGVSMESNQTYQVTIQPFNFEAPRILYPQSGETITADIDEVVIGQTLKRLNGSEILPFGAIDNDVGIFGDVSFVLNSVNNDHEYFAIDKLNRTHSTLIVSRAVQERTFEFSVTAIDGGSLTSDPINMRVTFVNRTSDPIFNLTEFSTDFTENVTGQAEVRIIPSAYDIKNIDNPIFEIYYFIDPLYNPSDAELFALDKSTRELKIANGKMLDRETIDHHEIKVFASNSPNYSPSQRSNKTELIINISVNDVNDNPPKFDDVPYEVGISESDYILKPIFTFHATDPDLEDYLRLTYRILSDTLTVSNSDLEPFLNNPFILNINSGVLTLNFEVQEDIVGHFSFQVEVRDLADHTDRVTMKVSVIPESSRFSFLFINTTDEVSGADQARLTQILSDQYGAECIRDDISPLTKEDGTANMTITVYRAHFTKDDDIVNASYIQDRGSQPLFLDYLVTRLRSELGLELHEIPKRIKVDPIKTDYLMMSLGIVSGVLGLLLITGICFHVIKMRSYNRQIKALSVKKYDSNDHKINNIPRTNEYTQEKPNPIMANADFNAKDLDTKSIISQESDDFAGLENNHFFDISSKVDEKPKNPLSQNGIERTRADSSTYA